MVFSRFWCSRLISTRSSERSFASRFDSGSSNRNTSTSRTSARPIATRCRWPPDSAAGLRSSSGSICRISDARAMRLSISGPGSRAFFSPNARFPRTVICG